MTDNLDRLRMEAMIDSLRQQVKELETEAANTNHTMNEYRRELAALKREKQHLINGIGRGEPVAWMHAIDSYDKDGRDRFEVYYEKTPGYCIPLYTSAPTIPAELFDGFAVYQAISEKAKARTSPENVSDVLDAVVRLLRAAAPKPKEPQTCFSAGDMANAAAKAFQEGAESNRAAIAELVGALIEMEREKTDYMLRKNLGDPACETTNKMARAAIAKYEPKP